MSRRHSNDEASARKDLANVVGIWRLVSMARPDSAAGSNLYWDDRPTGLIIYTGDGHMAAQLYDSRRPRLGVRWELASLKAARTAYAGLITYFGAYSVDRASATITHNVQGAMAPDWIGSTLVRAYRFLTPDRLELRIVTDGTGQRVANGTIVVWDLAGGRRLARPFEAPRWSAPGRLPQGGLANMAATGDGERFAVLGAGYVDVFTSRTLKRTARILVSAAGPPSGVAIAPDGTIAVTTSDGRLGLGHLTSQTALGPLHKDHDGESWSPSFSGDGRWLATLGPANDVNLWDVHRRRLVNTNYGPQSGTVAAVALSPDGLDRS